MKIKNLKVGDKVKLIKFETLLKNGVIIKDIRYPYNHYDSETKLFINKIMIKYWNTFHIVRHIFCNEIYLSQIDSEKSIFDNRDWAYKSSYIRCKW